MEPNASQASEDAGSTFLRLSRLPGPCADMSGDDSRRASQLMKMLAPDQNFLFPFSHMKPDPSNKTGDAIIGKKSVENADQCPRVTGVTQAPEAEVEGRGTVRKLVQDPYCLAYVFANLPDDGSNVAITCPVSGHTFYASVTERL